MSRSGLRSVLLLTMWLSVCGCETANLAKLFEPQPVPDFKAEETNRRDYQSTRSRKALRWLLANRIQPGLSYREVCTMLGEEGIQEYNANWLKTKGGNYRIDDTAYKFGPDDKGQSVYLVFRDDCLVNFNADSFRDSNPPAASYEKGGASQASSSKRESTNRTPERSAQEEFSETRDQ